MKKKTTKIAIPQTKVFKKNFKIQVTKTGYLVNKNGKVLNLKLTK